MADCFFGGCSACYAYSVLVAAKQGYGCGGSLPFRLLALALLSSHGGQLPLRPPAEMQSKE